jgi:hypothetical protein
MSATAIAEKLVRDFLGLSRARDGRLSECWVEREAPKFPAGDQN